MKNKFNKKKIFIFFILLVVILPYYLCILQSLPSADDFGMRNISVGFSAIVNAVHRANGYYMEWGGTWPTWFVTILLNPLNYVGYHVEMIGIELVIFFTIWLLALVFFLQTFFKVIFKINFKGINITLTAAALIFLLNQRIYTQVFYWYCGGPYLWWMSTTFLLWSVVIRYFEVKKTTSSIVMLSVIGFITCFAQYYIVPVIFFTFLFLLMEYRNRKLKIPDTIPIMFMIAGAILTVVSPGNYIRHDVIDNTGVHPIRALWMTLKFLIVQQLEMISIEHYFVEILIILFLGIALRKYVYKLIHPNWILLVGGIITFGSIYPVVLGYSSIDLPNRVVFLFDMFSALTVFFTVFMCGCLLRDKMINIDKKCDLRIATGIIVIISYLALIPSDSYKEIPSIKQYLKYTEVCEQHREWISVLNEISNSDESEVIVHRSSITDSGITKSVELTADPKVWRNVRIAEYYGKRSVSLELGN